MSDNYGPNQSRVLNVINRGLDNVVFQDRRPPLTSEWNLINQISNQKTQDISKLVYPSGWMQIEGVSQEYDELSALAGQVLCSESYAENTFKLMASSGLMAVVNGWPIVVQGTNSTDNDNVIYLEDPTGQYYDFVFLEVWRKLLSYDSPLYPYGNVLIAPFSSNEILYPPVQVETTKRVQIQYRIRTVSIATTVSPSSNIFDDIPINPIGGRTGEYVYDSFRSYGPSDVGLYVAGDGMEASQTSLNTVDGYVYAIPMFLVYRRYKSGSIFNATTINSAYVSKSMLVDGYRYDRPDNKLADAVYAEDVLDFRHKILTSGKDLDQLLDKTLSKLIAGRLTTAVKKGFNGDGQISMACSGATMQLKVERINSVGGDDIPDVGEGSSIASTSFKRRSFCNAETVHDHNIIEIPRPSATWQNGTVVVLNNVLTLPSGEIVSIDGFYSPTKGVVTGVSSTGVVSVTIINSGVNSLVGTSDALYMEYTFKYSASDAGFKDVPDKFVEVNKGQYQPIATRDQDVLLRFNNSGDLLNFGLNPNNGDTTDLDHIHYAGGNYTENSNFGHELVIYRTVNSLGKVTLSLNDSKLNGYYILGVKSVEIKTGSIYGNPVDFIMERLVTASPYVITDYIVTVSAYPSAEVKITLHTGSKFNDVDGDYPLLDSMKFFELSKQGRGVTDTFEVIEVVAVEETSGVYVVDTIDKPIIALVTKTRTEGGFVEGYPFAFRFDSNGTSVTILDTNINKSLPVLSSAEYTASILPTRLKIGASAGLVKIRVPVLVHSYVASNEPSYNFYYRFCPYQGILGATTEFYGKFEKEGPAIITTLGSGAVVNYGYSGGKAVFTENSRSVAGVFFSGISPKWLRYVMPGDYIRKSGSSQYYRILLVNSDTDITLAERFVGSVSGDNAYEIVRIDVPLDGVSNVVDRMPAYSISSSSSDQIADYTCASDVLDSYDAVQSLLISKPYAKDQDPMNTIPNDFKLGDSVIAKRGRNDISLSDGLNDIFKISVDGKYRPYIKYRGLSTEVSGNGKKVYQIYLFSRSAKQYMAGKSDMTGRIYMVVLSGESVDTTQNALVPFYNYDTVDVFELINRPIWK